MGDRPQAAAVDATPTPPKRAASEILPWDEALRALAGDLPRVASGAASEEDAWVVEPFVHGLTGAYSTGTRQMTQRVAAGWQARASLAPPLPFTPQAVAKARWLLMGSLTPSQISRRAQAATPTWRLCAAVADLRTGVVVSKAIAFASGAGIETRPSAFFRDAPLSLNDPATPTLDRRCQGWHPGEALPSSYRARLAASPFISRGIELYDGGSPAQALLQFQSAMQVPSGHQFRSHTGLYLSQSRLGRRQDALESLQALVDQGLDQGGFSLQFFYRPGSTAVLTREGKPLQGDERLRVVAQRLAKRLTCAEIVLTDLDVDTARPSTLDSRLAALRAEQVLRQLFAAQPVLKKRLRLTDSVLAADQNKSLPSPSRTPHGQPAAVRFRTIDCY